MAEAPSVPDQIAAVRRFNRFYTQHIGVLQNGWLDSAFSLAEARLLYEIRRRGETTASALCAELGLDAGYVSRILRAFQKRGLIARKTSAADARQSLISLTAAGRRAYAPLEKRTNADIAVMLSKLPDDARNALTGAMAKVETILHPAEDKHAMPSPACILRAPRHGDFGWIVTAHAQLYAREYGWGDPFEGLCAQICADFVNQFDARWERCWIAERDGENVGSVMLVKDKPGERQPDVARLRLLLVTPQARGLGLGRQLTDECVRFARDAGYKSITLWTHSILTGARHIYEKAGFTLTSSEPRHTWGKDVVAEFWDMKL